MYDNALFWNCSSGELRIALVSLCLIIMKTYSLFSNTKSQSLAPIIAFTIILLTEFFIISWHCDHYSTCWCRVLNWTNRSINNWKKRVLIYSKAKSRTKYNLFKKVLPTVAIMWLCINKNIRKQIFLFNLNIFSNKC